MLFITGDINRAMFWSLMRQDLRIRLDDWYSGYCRNLLERALRFQCLYNFRHMFTDSSAASTRVLSCSLAVL